MYKVFVNDSFFFINEKKNSDNINHHEIPVLNAKEIDILLKEYQKTGSPFFGSFVYEVDNMKYLKTDIEKFARFISAAGGVVRNKANQFLIIKRLGLWDLPKGKVEKQENLRNAAVREVKEECEVIISQVVSNLPSTFHMYIHKGDWMFKETSWFEMLTEYNGIPIPQVEEDILIAEWVNSDEFKLRMKDSYPSLKELISGSF